MHAEAVAEVDWNLPPVEPRQVLTGVLVLLACYVVGRVLEVVLQRYWRWRGRSASFSVVFAMLAKWFVVAIGAGAALTIAFPSVRPVDVLGGVGVISIAAGIAFQQVLGNLFAGVILLLREPFGVNDQVAIGDVRGTVMGVNLRETIVRTFDGRRVVIPNNVVHDGIVTVQTGYERVRTSVVVGIGYDSDLDVARELATSAMGALPEVATEPAPEVLVTTFGPSTVDLELRFWSGARQLETLEARSRVIAAVLTAFRENGIDMPADVRVLESSPSLDRALARAGTDSAGEDGEDGEGGTGSTSARPTGAAAGDRPTRSERPSAG